MTSQDEIAALKANITAMLEYKMKTGDPTHGNAMLAIWRHRLAELQEQRADEAEERTHELKSFADWLEVRSDIGAVYIADLEAEVIRLAEVAHDAEGLFWRTLKARTEAEQRANAAKARLASALAALQQVRAISDEPNCDICPLLQGLLPQTATVLANPAASSLLARREAEREVVAALGIYADYNHSAAFDGVHSTELWRETLAALARLRALSLSLSPEEGEKP